METALAVCVVLLILYSIIRRVYLFATMSIEYPCFNNKQVQELRKMIRQEIKSFELEEFAEDRIEELEESIADELYP